MNSKIISFAIEAHSKTNHLYDGHPYSVHLSMVAMYAQKYIHILPTEVQSDVLDACWLHDTIEDCRLSYNDILAASNQTVADLVYAVTNEKGKNRDDRANNKYYEGIRNTPYATFVKLCDRLANIKYSVDKKSRMAGKYFEENEHFIKCLFPEGPESYGIYSPLINKINEYLSQRAVILSAV